MATKHFSDTAIADVQQMLEKADASGAYQKALLDIVDYFNFTSWVEVDATVLPWYMDHWQGNGRYTYFNVNGVILNNNASVSVGERNVTAVRYIVKQHICA